MKKVSIIMPCYNKGKYLAEAIMSATSQTYENIEIICVNDCSTDNTSDILKEQAIKYKNVLVFDNEENLGVCKTRNFAIEKASGDYILPLDADDIIEPTYVEKAVKVLDKNDNIGIVYCRARLFGSKNKIWTNVDLEYKEEILYGNKIFCSALFRKSDFIKAGGYNPNMKYGCEDWDLWLSFLDLGLDVYQIPEILFNYRKYREKSKTNEFDENKDKGLNQLVKNHVNLYLDDKRFAERVYTDIDTLKRREKKYKKLFFVLLPVAIVEAICMVVCLFLNTL